MYELSRSLTIVASGVLLSTALLAATTFTTASTAYAGVNDCRAAAGKIAAVVAKKKSKLLSKCQASGSCSSSRVTEQEDRLKTKSQAKLAAACRAVTGADLAWGDSCPDNTGQCDDEVGVVACLYCLIEKGINPLLDVVQGSGVDLSEPCGGCSTAQCADGSFCDTVPGLCDSSAVTGFCAEIPEACTDEFAPVCGCDGTTYSNNCERRKASVGLRHRGACKTHCGETPDDVCPEGTFCEGLPGHCDTTPEGVCLSQPEDCPRYGLPVCGCDGVTYDSDCERRAAGVRLHTLGPCEPEGCLVNPSGTGPDGGVETCPTGEFCQAPAGACGDASSLSILPPWLEGDCEPVPVDCPDEERPVCGCDGNTYFNDCERRQAGVSREHRGACEARCGGSTGNSCGGGSVCEYPPLECGEPDAEGVCVSIPDGCPDFEDPVCGCDGVTYLNDCERLAAGAQLEHFGACRADCVSNPNVCDSDEQCVAVGFGCSDQGPGECVPQDFECPLFYKPVCGCDGETYQNPCEAFSSGVGVDYDGPCEEFGCSDSGDCGVDESCVPLPGTCHFPGAPTFCVSRADCEGLLPGLNNDPVCGCDGNTYPSLCDTVDAGVGVAYIGPCFDVNF